MGESASGVSIVLFVESVYVAGTVSSCSVSGIIVLTEKFGIDKLFKYLFPTCHTVPMNRGFCLVRNQID